MKVENSSKRLVLAVVAMTAYSTAFFARHGFSISLRELREPLPLMPIELACHKPGDGQGTRFARFSIINIASLFKL
jgi:hypothetical protein